MTEPTDPTPPDAPPPPPPRAEDPWGSTTDWLRSLRRSSDDRLLGGVCGGFARRTGLPTLVWRGAAIALGFLGIGVPLYIVAWVLLPTEQGDRVMGRGPVRDLAAVGAVVVAGLMLLGQFGDISYFSLVGRVIPWFLVLGGLALLLRRHEAGSTSTPPTPPAPPWGAGAAPTTPAGSAITTTFPAVADPTAGPAAIPTAPSSATPPPPPAGFVVTDAATAQMPASAPRVVSGPPPVLRAPRPPRPRPVVGPLTWCLALLALGTMGLLAAGGVDGVGPGVMASVVMLVFGAGLTVSAVAGRARGLILPAVALGSGLALLTALDVRADNLAGQFDRTYRDGSEIPALLETTIGVSRLDLRHLELDTDRTLRIEQTGGSLEVVLPSSVSTTTTVTTGTGAIRWKRPSARFSLFSPNLASRLVDGGLPRVDDPVTDAEWSEGAAGNLRERDGRDGRTVVIDHGGAVLTLRIDMGVGTVNLIDPRWADVPDDIVRPAQLCTVGGGPVGTVEPCGDVPTANRVPLCIDEMSSLVDCRETDPGTVDFPRVPACRGYDGIETACDAVGVRALGVELVDRDALGDPDDIVEPPADDGDDPTTATAPTAETSTTTASTTTVAPTTTDEPTTTVAELTVPPAVAPTVPAPAPVPTPGG